MLIILLSLVVAVQERVQPFLKMAVAVLVV